MRLTKHKRNTRAAMNMTPMIDIVFLLIIFFMTVTQVSKVNKTQMELPKLKGSQDQQPSQMIINVNETGGIEITGRPRTMAEVLTLVSDEFAAVGSQPDRVKIVVRADRRGNSQMVNEIVEKLGKLGLNQIKIMVQSE